MRRPQAILYAFALVVASGAAFGVDSSPDDVASKRHDPRRTGREVSKVPSTPIEVELALKQLDADERDATEEQAAIDTELGTLRSRSVARGRTYYKQIHAGLLPAGAGFDELVDYAARVERLRRSIQRDLERQKTLEKRHDELEAVLTRIRTERGPLDATKETLRRAGSMMRAADDRRAAFDRAFQTSTNPPDYVAIYGADLGPSDTTNTSEPFASRFGRLALPVTGRAEVEKIDGGSGRAPALELHAKEGASAQSVAPGRVVFADRYEDLGMTVIVDHGEEFFSVYGNLSELGVKKGDDIRNGEALGQLGQRYGQGGVVLYFELRKNGKPTEPAPWFGL